MLTLSSGMFALALVSVDAGPTSPPCRHRRPADTDTDTAAAAAAADTATPGDPHPDHPPDDRPRISPGVIASTLTNAGTKQPRDNLCSGQRRCGRFTGSPDGAVTVIGTRAGCGCATSGPVLRSGLSPR